MARDTTRTDPWGHFSKQLSTRITEMKVRSYLVLSFRAFGAEHYVQLARGGSDLLLECSACPPIDGANERPIPFDRFEVFGRIGWTTPDADGYPNFRMDWSGKAGRTAKPTEADIADVVAVIVQSLREGFHVGAPMQLTTEQFK